MTILQMLCLSTIWLKMCHFFRSGSDHGKCGVKLKLSTVGVHSCVFLVVSLVAMPTGAENYSKTEVKVRFTSNQHTSGHQYGY